MNSSYLSYKPDDYFWSSVKNDFDFSVCKDIFNQKEDMKNHPSFLLNGIITMDSSCNCPTTPVTNTTSFTTDPVTNTPSVMKSTNIDDYTKQLCYNYIYSKKLINLQNQTSASQMNFSDNTDGYSKLLRQTIHVSVGILAIMIAIGYS